MSVTGVLSRSTPEMPRLFFRIGVHYTFHSLAPIRDAVGTVESATTATAPPLTDRQKALLPSRWTFDMATEFMPHG